MEEEVSYSTVTFKNGQPPKETKDGLTVYAEVKPKAPASASHGEAAAKHSHSHWWVVCLGILSFFLVVSIGLAVHFDMLLTRKRGKVNEVIDENQQLYLINRRLQTEMKKLNNVIDNLNWTLNFILEYDTFPVNEFCPEKKCQPCRKDWIMFQEKCYLFYDKEPRWKQWEESRKFCQSRSADLVVVDTLQEQEFLSNHTEFYYDKLHGFWMGLTQTTNKSWVWIDGHDDTLSYWIMEDLGTVGPRGLMIPGRKPTASWDPAALDMENKFICETEVLIRSD
uniref:natural killer cells antigen CD94-like isoform X2 n=1 Tax=Scatophagus argus TaxID=75038 RepID=UPI001ED8226E|nr:natural killer cells antigen CD94-like isoform X2 [Scatophagus argus]